MNGHQKSDVSVLTGFRSVRSSRTIVLAEGVVRYGIVDWAAMVRGTGNAIY